MKPIIIGMLIAVLVVGCSSAGTTPVALTPAPGTGTPSATRVIVTPTLENHKVISVALRVRDSAESVPKVAAGSVVALQASFEPVLQSLQRRPDGSVLSSSTTRWDNSPVARMRVCIAPESTPCDPGDWRPYEALVSQTVEVDWLGPRTFSVWAEFSDA